MGGSRHKVPGPSGLEGALAGAAGGGGGVQFGAEALWLARCSF